MINYDRSKVEIGILHFGLGGFHRAHQAVFADLAIENGNYELGIASISQRDPSLADEMNAADSIYEVEASDGIKTDRRTIGAIKESLFYSRDEARILEIARSPKLKAITLTVTEKAYKPDSDFTARLIKALRARFEVGGSSIAVISCDNLPSNGDFIRNLLKEAVTDNALWSWIDSNVRFPNCMVDRIVPAPSKDNRLLVRTEIFNQWIIEKDPISKYLESAGVQFVDSVKPYELAKIRLFNGIHSYLAYYGELNQIDFIADIITIPHIHQFVKELQENEICKTLDLDIDLTKYSQEIRERMSNPTLHHKASQIAMDGSQKMPQRMIGVLNDLAKNGTPAPKMVEAFATWIKYLAVSNSINDPLSEKLKPLALAKDLRSISTLLSTPFNSIYDSQLLEHLN